MTANVIHVVKFTHNNIYHCQNYANGKQTIIGKTLLVDVTMHQMNLLLIDLTQ